MHRIGTYAKTLFMEETKKHTFIMPGKNRASIDKHKPKKQHRLFHTFWELRDMTKLKVNK